MIQIETYQAQQVESVIGELAQLRMEVFREYPYLYDGNLQYEEKYLRAYLESSYFALIVAKDDDKIVGASTCLPLIDEVDEVRAPFMALSYDIDKIFYLGESVLLRPYRDKGIGVRFFEAREAHARRLGGFEWATFCAVERPADDPRRPADYVPLHNFWRKRGYFKRDELDTFFSWKEVGESEESLKPMTFWMKHLFQLR